MSEESSHEIQKHYLDRLAHLEDRLERLEDDIRREQEEYRAAINLISNNVQKTLDYQRIREPVLDSIETIMRGGLVIKWILMATVGALGLIATAATAWDALHRWTK